MSKNIKNTPPEGKSFFKAYGAALLWAALILLLISLPGEDLPNFDFWAIDIEDKLGHIGVFAVLSFLLVIGTHGKRGRLTRKEFVWVFLIGSFYGGFTEMLQGVVFTSRVASLSDFLADVLGTLAGTVVGKIYVQRRGI
jgi:VanZ family protein